MNYIPPLKKLDVAPSKFSDTYQTADGSDRASVPLSGVTTLWFNTGTLCNIECTNCYIDSSPSNDALAYLKPDDVMSFLDQVKDRNWPVREIGFTGGEPFLNPDMITLADMALTRGYEVLILTNAMRPMMRKRVKSGLIDLNSRFPNKLTLRVSLDHHQERENDGIRGKGSFAAALGGMDWLRDNSFQMTVAARTIWNETEDEARVHFTELFEQRGYDVNAADPGQLILFPEMDEAIDVPEITTACWDILGKRPEDIMCATSRMVVKRKGAIAPVVLSCTLLPYVPEFELGNTLAKAEGKIYLNHRHCAKFCVLGGASCSS